MNSITIVVGVIKVCNKYAYIKQSNGKYQFPSESSIVASIPVKELIHSLAVKYNVPPKRRKILKTTTEIHPITDNSVPITIVQESFLFNVSKFIEGLSFAGACELRQHLIPYHICLLDIVDEI